MDKISFKIETISFKLEIGNFEIFKIYFGDDKISFEIITFWFELSKFHLKFIWNSDFLVEIFISN